MCKPFRLKTLKLVKCYSRLNVAYISWYTVSFFYTVCHIFVYTKISLTLSDDAWALCKSLRVIHCRVWDLQDFGEQQQKLLPHPAFVYCSQFHSRVDTIAVTGSYDQVIRVWDVGDDSKVDVSSLWDKYSHNHTVWVKHFYLYCISMKWNANT